MRFCFREAFMRFYGSDAWSKADADEVAAWWCGKRALKQPKEPSSSQKSPAEEPS